MDERREVRAEEPFDLVVAVSEHRQQRPAELVLDLAMGDGGGGVEPLTDPRGVGEQERLPVRAGPRATPTSEGGLGAPAVSDVESHS